MTRVWYRVHETEFEGMMAAFAFAGASAAIRGAETLVLRLTIASGAWEPWYVVTPGGEIHRYNGARA